jgi:hypothetical protein
MSATSTVTPGTRTLISSACTWAALSVSIPGARVPADLVQAAARVHRRLVRAEPGQGQVIDEDEEAVRQGMHGSPTILVDGVDPFAGPGQSGTVPCRLYRGSDGRVGGAPSVSQLRQVIGEPAGGVVMQRWRPGRLPPQCSSFIVD